MGVIDEEGEGLSGVDGLHASAYAGDGFEGVDAGGEWDVFGESDGEGGECVPDVEVAGEFEVGFCAAPGGGDAKGESVAVGYDGVGAYVGGVVDGVGEAFGVGGGGVEEEAVVGIVGVDDGDFAVFVRGVGGVFAEEFKEAGFVAAVLFDGAVVFEVFEGDVGEEGDVEGAAAEAVPAGGEGVRGGFDDGVVAVCGHHVAQEGLDVGGFGGALAGGVGPLALGDFEIDGADHAGGVPACFEDGAGEGGGGGFAVGAGDADDAQGGAGVVVEGGGDGGEGGAGVGDVDPGGVVQVGWGGGLGEDGAGSACEGLGDVGVSIDVVAVDGDEEAAGLDGARVVGEGGDGARGGSGDVCVGQGGEEGVELHGFCAFVPGGGGRRGV